MTTTDADGRKLRQTRGRLRDIVGVGKGIAKVIGGVFALAVGLGAVITV